MRSFLGRMADTAATVVTVPIAVATAATAIGLEAGVNVATLPVRQAKRLPTPDANAVLAVAKELIGGKPVRRCWRGNGHCWVEVGGLDTERGPKLGAAVLDAVGVTPGVTSVQLNVPLARVVVHVDDDGPTLRDLCALVDCVEQQQSTGDSDDDQPTDLPADGVVLAGRAMAAAANGIGQCAAVAGRALMWPSLPTGLTAAVTLVDYQPRLRARWWKPGSVRWPRTPRSRWRPRRSTRSPKLLRRSRSNSSGIRCISVRVSLPQKRGNGVPTRWPHTRAVPTPRPPRNGPVPSRPARWSATVHEAA